jgi:hypothetical protein
VNGVSTILAYVTSYYRYEGVGVDKCFRFYTARPKLVFDREKSVSVNPHVL